MRYWMVMILTAFMSLAFSAPATADNDKQQYEKAKKHDGDKEWKKEGVREDEKERRMGRDEEEDGDRDRDRDREHMDGDGDKERSMKAGDAGVEQSNRLDNKRQGQGPEKGSPWWWPF